jgi:Cohesin domain
MEKETKTAELREEITQAPITHVEEQVKEKTAWMPKKTFLLIALLVLITACLLALALIPSFKGPAIKVKPVANINYAQTQLSFSAPIIATASGYKTDVLISTGKNKVTVAQLEIAYDPKILTNVDIKAGSFFTDPTILLKKVDVVNGRITYVIGISLGGTPTVGKGTVATISFSTLPGQTTARTPINFLPKTAVNAAGYVQSVLLKSTGVLFSISPTPTVAK